MLRPFHILQTAKLAASDGEIGHVTDFYFNDEDWTLRYFVVNTGSWLLGRHVLVSPQSFGEVDTDHGHIAVHLTRKEVRESPPLDFEKPVSRQKEEELHRHYGWDPYWLPPDGGAGMMLPPSALAPPPAYAPRPELFVDPEPILGPDGKQPDPHLRSASELASGYFIHAEDGEIGRIDDFILEDQGWALRYFVVHTGPWFLGKDALLPCVLVERISYEATEAVVKLPRETIKQAPPFRRSDLLNREYEQRLHDHYGLKGHWDTPAA